MLRPDISVVLCTLNPSERLLSWALDSLERQTLPSRQFEVVVVDNGSTVPVASFAAVQGRPFPLRVLREERNGTAYARCAGILDARAELIVFVDDDNHLDPDYLERALDIAYSEPHVGAFGGITRLLSDAPVPPGFDSLLIYVGVRHYGEEVITSNENRWGPWEPIGAGMIFRKSVGLKYVDIVQTNPLAPLLGRSKSSYICGEDSLLARCGYGLGYYCSYRPELKLTHYIRSARLKPLTLARTIAGVARANVLCEIVLGTSEYPQFRLRDIVFELTVRMRHRVRTRGIRAGLLEWFWDVGYFRQISEYHVMLKHA